MPKNTCPRCGAVMDDEQALVRFLAMCQESLDPERYEAVLEACASLCLVRKSLKPDTLARLLEELQDADTVPIADCDVPVVKFDGKGMYP